MSQRGQARTNPDEIERADSANAEGDPALRNAIPGKERSETNSKSFRAYQRFPT